MFPNRQQIYALFTFISLCFCTEIYLKITPSLFAEESQQSGIFSFGPTGIIGKIIEKETHQRIHVSHIISDSPAHGKILPGDFITGIQNSDFQSGTNLLHDIGTSLLHLRDQQLTLHVQRSKNVKPSDQTLINTTLSLDELFRDERTDNEEFQSTPQFISFPKRVFPRTEEALKLLDITLDLPHVDSSLKKEHLFPEVIPWVQAGLRAIRTHLKKHPSDMGDRFLLAHVLMGSGKEQDLKLVKNYVRSHELFIPERKVVPSQSSTQGLAYQLLFAAQYYLQTNDAYIRDVVAELASVIANAQTHSGTWGPKLTIGPEARASLPGIDNNLSGICFIGLIMTMRSGIQTPKIEEAIYRARDYLKTIYLRGGVPKNISRALRTETSSGRNGMASIGLNFMGENETSLFFTLYNLFEIQAEQNTFTSSETVWSRLGLIQAGDLAIKEYLKTQKVWLSLCRRHDGGFFIQKKNGGILNDRESTAIQLLPFLALHKNNLLMGKETRSPIDHGQLEKLETLTPIAHTSNLESWSLEDLFSRMDSFLPTFRRSLAREVANRYLSSKDGKIIEILIRKLSDQSPLVRATASLSISTCGTDLFETKLEHVKKLLDDEHEYVRMSAIEAFASLIQTEGSSALSSIIDVLIRDEYQSLAVDSNTVVGQILDILSSDQYGKNGVSFFADPFNYGLEREKVLAAVRRALKWDPGREKILKLISRWPSDQIHSILGSLVWTAETHQMNDVSNGLRALSLARELLDANGYRAELAQAISYNIKKLEDSSRNELTSDLDQLTELGPVIPSKWINKIPGYSSIILPGLKKILLQKPLIRNHSGGTLLLNLLQNGMAEEIDQSASIGFKSAKTQLQSHLDSLSNEQNRIGHCRKLLNPKDTNIYMQMAALEKLVDYVGVDAVSNLLPYLNHDQWRWKDLSRKLLHGLKPEVTQELCKHLNISKDISTRLGILSTLSEIRDPNAIPHVFPIAVSGDSRTRAKAMNCLLASSGTLHTKRMTTLVVDSTDDIVLGGYEDAILNWVSKEDEIDTLCEDLRNRLSECSLNAHRTFTYLLAQFGGNVNLDRVRDEGLKKDENLVLNAADALSLSPHSASSNLLLELIEFHGGTPRVYAIAAKASRRLISDDIHGHRVSNDEELAFAEKILSFVSDRDVLRYLGTIRSPASAELLYHFMQRSPASVSDAALEGLLELSEKVNQKPGDEASKSIAPWLKMSKQHLEKHRLNEIDFLSGKLLFPHTPSHLSQLTFTLQQVSPQDNSTPDNPKIRTPIK